MKYTVTLLAAFLLSGCWALSNPVDPGSPQYTGGAIRYDSSVELELVFTGPSGQEVSLSRTDDLQFTRGEGFAVSVIESFDSFFWMIDGIPAGETTASISIDTGLLNFGTHNLTVAAEKNGVIFTEDIRFRIVN